MSVDENGLIERAKAARDMAYAPFSQFRVGAALRAKDGSIFTGGNVENPSYGLTMCAERVAIGAAASAGVRPGEIVAVAICAQADMVSPCGACRQVLFHFCDPLAPIYCHALPSGVTRESSSEELLPHAFDLRPVSPNV